MFQDVLFRIYQRIIRYSRPTNASQLRPRIVPMNQPLPEVLCFDEFKSVKNVSGTKSFIMMDGKTN